MVQCNMCCILLRAYDRDWKKTNWNLKCMVGDLFKKIIIVTLVKKSLRIPRAIAKLSGLNLFISSVDGVGP